MTFKTPEGARREAQESASVKHSPDDRLPKDRSKRPPSKSEVERRKEQSRHALLSRDDIERDYNLTRRWLELAALTGDGPPMVKLSRRMVRYRRGVFEDWLDARTVFSTSSTLNLEGVE